MTEIEARLEAMKALIAAPFVIFIIVIIISAVLFAATIERKDRS